jgi:DNA-binding CsgD family transcriptional regulator
MRGEIAIISNNMLENIGLKLILENLVPVAEVMVFYDINEMRKEQDKTFIHYFITPQVLRQDPFFFVTQQRKTIIMTTEDICSTNIPNDFHTVKVDTPLHELIQQLLSLLAMGHHPFQHFPESAVDGLQKGRKEKNPLLTVREADILRNVALGKSSKEIAKELKVSLSTVVTHRKNIMDKINAHSATKLVIYAVTHGYVNPEDIV